MDDFTVTDCATGKVILHEGFEPVDLSRVEPVFQWEKWDAAMEKAFATYHFNAFVMSVAGLGGGTFQARTEPSLLGYPGDSPEYDLLMGKYLKGIESHLKEKGWLEKCVCYPVSDTVGIPRDSMLGFSHPPIRLDKNAEASTSLLILSN